MPILFLVLIVLIICSTMMVNPKTVYSATKYAVKATRNKLIGQYVGLDYNKPTYSKSHVLKQLRGSTGRYLPRNRRYNPTKIQTIDHNMFEYLFNIARTESDRISQSCSLFSHTENSKYFISDDFRSGFCIRPDGELCLVFSVAKNRGKLLIRHAIKYGANKLDCFDGYLPNFYANHGFKEIRRESNWTPNGPDIVYMSR